MRASSYTGMEGKPLSTLRKKIKTGPGQATSARKPAFMCSAHPFPAPMRYDPEIARWVCTQPNCVQTRQPSNGDDTVILKHSAKLVVVVDEDGDAIPHLYWPEYKIMCPLDFQSTKLFRAKDGGRFLRWEFSADNVLFVDEKGKELP